MASDKQLRENSIVNTMCIRRYYKRLRELMTITKKLTKHGNSLALVIERPILELLGINNSTLLEVSTPDGESIVITPVKSKSHSKKLSASLKKINKKYGHALKHLAE